MQAKNSQKTHATLKEIFNRVLEVVKVHVDAKFHQAKCSGSKVIMLIQTKNSDNAVNNTAITSTGRKYIRIQSTDINLCELVQD